MKMTNVLEKSVIVSAHPDDEVLWFSSILDKVKEIIICFLECKSKPHWMTGRKQSLSEHPIKNIFCLGLEESETFNGSDWKNPVTTIYGIQISNKKMSDKKYKKNYYELKQNLENRLVDCENVFTHNPWGEYGNEEHVQVYRVVKELQGKMKFNVWFSNYCSKRSSNLMLNYLSSFYPDYVTLETNKVLADSIKKIYKNNGCWTWYDDWQWLDEESFMKDSNLDGKGKKNGYILPLNFISFDFPNKSKRKFNIFSIFH